MEIFDGFCIKLNLLQPLPEEQLRILYPFPAVVDLLRYMLARMPIARPSPDKILLR